MAVRVFAPIPSLCAYAAARMRERDRVEFSAFEDFDAMRIGRNFACSHFVRCIGLNTPDVVLAGSEILPGVWYAAAFATDNFGRLVKAATRHTQEMMDQARALGGRRVETRYWAQHEDSRTWLHFLGFRDECRLPGLGRNGEDFIQCAVSLKC